MRASSLGRSSLIAALAATAVAACSAAGGRNGFTTSEGSGGSGAGNSSSTGQGMGGNATITGLTDGGMGGGTPGMSSAYAHTNNTLFKFDPSQPTQPPTQIGTFTCIGGSGQDSSMTDLAVNSTGDVWAISSHNVYKLTLPSGGTGPVNCASTFSLAATGKATFYGLTFAPVGVIDPNKEVLIGGNTAGELWEIDISTTPPTLTQHGTLGTVPANDGHGHNYGTCTNKTGDYCGKVGSAWELSGDIVFMANNGNPLGFATVRDCETPPSSSNCNSTDTLVELDLMAIKTAGTQSVTKSVRGAVVKASGCNDTAHASYGSMYGIAAYEDKVFGFSHGDYIVTISNNDGTACLVQNTANDSWAGAAITTVAPVMPPTTQ